MLHTDITTHQHVAIDATEDAPVHTHNHSLPIDSADMSDCLISDGYKTALIVTLDPKKKNHLSEHNKVSKRTRSFFGKINSSHFEADNKKSDEFEKLINDLDNRYDCEFGEIAEYIDDYGESKSEHIKSTLFANGFDIENFELCDSCKKNTSKIIFLFKCALGIRIDKELEEHIQVIWNDTVKIGSIRFARISDEEVKQSFFINAIKFEVRDGIRILDSADDYLDILRS